MSGIYISLTDSLKGVMDNYKEKLSPAKYDEFLEWVYQGITFYRDQLKKIPAGFNRAYAVHSFIDEELQRNQKEYPNDWKQVSCQSGCSACCYKTVILTEDEADLLVRHCEEQGIEIDREHLENQAGFTGTPDEYFDQPKEITRCVFLKDNKCSVYKHRPAACRKFFVLSDPEHCGGKSGKQTMNLVDNNVEFIASGAMDIDHSKVGDMPDILLRRLDAGDGIGSRQETTGREKTQENVL